MSEERLLPTIDTVNAPFWEGCREGVLRLQQCPQSGRLVFPPRPLNPWTPRVALQWREVSGRGSVWSVIEPHPPLMLSFSDLAPYNVIVVALEEDPHIRLVGNLVPAAGAAIDRFAYDDIDIGLPVQVVFEYVNEQVTLPRWMPVDPAPAWTTRQPETPR